MAYIEKNLPTEELGKLAHKEAHARSPIYQMHKWWARRSSSVFRMFVLASFADDDVTEYQLWEQFYNGANLKDKIVLDPFMGGGTTIVESLRLGCKVIGRDINPVAWFITKKEAEPIELDKLDVAFAKLQKSAGRFIKNYYRTKCPNGHDAEVMYAFWIKHVPCPKCDQLAPIFPSYIISNKKGVSTIYCPQCSCIFETTNKIRVGGLRSKPLSAANRTCSASGVAANPSASSVECPNCHKTFAPDKGVAGRGKYTCPICGNHERFIEAVKRTNTHFDATLFALEAYCPQCGRVYKSADENDIQLFEKAKSEFEARESELLFPRQKIPTEGRNDPRPVNYGYTHFHILFNERQLLCLSKLLSEILKIEDENVREFMLLAFSDCLDTNNIFCKYETNYQKISLLFGLNAYHPIERYAENNVWGTKFGRGSFTKCFEKMRRGKAYFAKRTTGGSSQNVLVDDFSDLQNEGKNALLTAGNSEDLSFLPSQSVDAVITDPPYFDKVMYSELADFFYVWLRLGLKEQYEYFHPELSSRPEEIIQNEKSGKDVDFFANGLTNVFKECHRVLKDEGLMLFTFHHNKLWAWENLTKVLLDSGFYVSSAPIVRSEGKSGYHSQSGNVKYDACLVCRKWQSTSLRVCHKGIPLRSDWKILKNQIQQQAIHWLERLIKSGMELNEVDMLVIVMGKFLEAFTCHYPNIIYDGNLLDIHPAIHEMPRIINELASEVVKTEVHEQGRKEPLQLTLHT